MTASSVAMVLLISVVAAALPSVIAFFFIINFWYTIAAYVVITVGVLIPFDRWLDNKVRPVKPVH